jgi:hypothetical protein
VVVKGTGAVRVVCCESTVSASFSRSSRVGGSGVGCAASERARRSPPRGGRCVAPRRSEVCVVRCWVLLLVMFGQRNGAF